jgi:hypothetical protein
LDFRSRSYPKIPPRTAAINIRTVILVKVSTSGISENSDTIVDQISWSIRHQLSLQLVRVLICKNTTSQATSVDDNPMQ